MTKRIKLEVFLLLMMLLGLLLMVQNVAKAADWVWPAKSFGINSLDYTYGGNKHNKEQAIDISYSESSPEAIAVVDGKIIELVDGKNKGSKNLGNYITIRADSSYGNYEITYGHLEKGKMKVKIGDSVKAGDAIGIIGTSGNSSGKHLHVYAKSKGKHVYMFEKYINNSRYMSKFKFKKGLEKYSKKYKEYILTYYELNTAKSHYVYKKTSESTPPPKAEASNISISGATAPSGENTFGTLGFYLRGKITSTYNLSSVTVGIYGSSGTAEQAKTVKPNTKTYDLANSTINNAILFAKLPAGSYSYKVTATDEKGIEKTLVNSSFSVKGAAAPAPAPAPAPEAKEDVKMLTLSFHPNGGDWAPPPINVEYAGWVTIEQGAVWENHRFLGWGGSVSETVYDHVGSSFQLGSDFTLYAKWEHTYGNDGACVYCEKVGQQPAASAQPDMGESFPHGGEPSNMQPESGGAAGTQQEAPAAPVENKPTPAPSRITISGSTAPTGSQSYGYMGFYLRGIVESTYTLKDVTVAIYDTKGKVVQKKSVNPNATKYDIGTKTINSSILFRELKKGSYVYRVTATDVKGVQVKLIESKFTKTN